MEIPERYKKFQRRKGGSPLNDLIIRLLEAKPISFNPELARALRSAKAGLFLSQLLYWSGKEKRKVGFLKQ